MTAEERAPGWQIRCIKCGFAEPWGKYGIRRGAIGKSFTIGRCSKCKWIRFHVIEKVPTAKPVNAD
jgi:predicted nucleic-acid-binding Zn-ribbon protein